MKLFTEIKLRNLFILTFLSFALLVVVLAVYSFVGKYKELRLYQLETEMHNVKLTHSVITKYQDELFLYNLNSYIKSNSDYQKFDIVIRTVISQIDSTIEENKVKQKTVNPMLEKLTDDYVVYQDIVAEILDINSEIYLPELGIDSKSNYIESNIRNERKYTQLGINIYIDRIKELESKLFNGNITKREFQNQVNLLIKEISSIQSTGDDKYYVLHFEDQVSNYYNNVLLQYNKFKTIGTGYNEGLMSALNEQNIEIYTRINDINNSISEYRANQFKNSFINYSIIIFVIVVISLLVLRVLYKTVYYPWKELEPHIYDIAAGRFPDNKSKPVLTELKIISVNLSKVVHELQVKNNIINELTKRNYSVNFEYKREDVLGQSIYMLKQDLLESEKQATQYRETEEHQKWTANGIAKIGAVMRQYTENISELSKNILRDILEYVDAVQGVIFITNREKNELEQVASFSYGKQRIQKNKIVPYEGLLGTVLVEKREYFWDTVPDDYLFMETGFGFAKPKSIFAFPLLFENSVYGIIEIASLEVIPEYKRAFLLNLANEIAITISYTEINVQTKQLLEQSKKQAQELQSNEKLYKKNQDNLKSLLRMTEERLAEREQSLKIKETIIKEKIEELLKVERELTSKEEYIDTVTNEYENIKSVLENQNTELRNRIEELEKRLGN